jgi:hypothetical protein
VTNNNLQITNPKPVTDNAAVLDAAKTLLSAAGLGFVICRLLFVT